MQSKRILGKRSKTIEKGVCKSKRNKKACCDERTRSPKAVDKKVVALRSFFYGVTLGLTKDKKRAPENNFAKQKNFWEEEQDD